MSPITDIFVGPGLETTEPRYALRSAALTFAGTRLLYHNGKKEYAFDFAELYFPATAGQPFVSKLSDRFDYVDTILAAADLRIERSKDGLPAARAISRQVYFIRHLLDWLRARGVYRLRDSTEEQTAELLAQLAQGGWGHALSLESRWLFALDEFEAEEINLAKAFHFRREDGTVRIETLKQPFWRKRLGWGGIAPITSTARKRVESLALDMEFSTFWEKREETECNPPRRHVLRNMMGWLNDIATLPASVDRLAHHPAERPVTGSKKMAQKPSSRTANLSVRDAVTLISSALKLLYETVPALLALYESARGVFPNISSKKRREWLLDTNPIRERLEKVIGRPITKWNCSGYDRRNPRSYSVDEVLGAAQGACAIVLAAMNARRQAEICDRDRGVRIGDLTVLDESLGLYQCWFYIEKTYRDRHLFYVNKTSADALQSLDRLKHACAPFKEDGTATASLFECGRFTEAGPLLGAQFSFSVDNSRTRSLLSFLKVTYDDPGLVPEIASHMFRRFFAILYFHRYEHAELRALKQHLRHLDIAMTRVYVTDPTTRALAEQIGAALTDSTQISQELNESLESEGIDIQITLQQMGKEKLQMAVDQILDGAPTAGGFSKIVRKLYRQMLPRVVTESQTKAAASDQIMGLLDGHGYQVKPMQHGQCHAPHVRRNLKGACEQDGILAREHATPRVCGNCPFHFNNTAYVQNLNEQLAEIASDMDDFMLPPQQQVRARFEHQNLGKLIILTERQMSSNANTINELSDSRKVAQA